MDAADLAESLNGKWEGTQYRCYCPVHGGHSLMVKPSERVNPLVSCFGGCEFREIARELESRGLWDASDRPAGPSRKKVEWARWCIRIFEEAKASGEPLGKQDWYDYRKAQGILSDAKEAGHA